MYKYYLYIDKLQSKRLQSRFLKQGDEQWLSAFFEDPQTKVIFTNPDNLSYSQQARYMVASQVERYESERFGLQALQLIETGEYVGLCGLLEQKVDEKIELEIGYHLLPKFRGLGLASEAARLFRDYAFAELKPLSLISIIHVDNELSKRVARANGMKPDFQTIWRDLPVEIFRLHRTV